MKKLYIAIALLCVSCVANAGLRQYSTNLGEVSDGLNFTAGIFASVMNALCIVVGIALLTGAITQYQVHKTNPKLVPLATPLTYAILSLLVFAIPTVSIISNISETEYGPSDIGFLESSSYPLEED